MLGGLDGSLCALAALAAIDYLTGLTAAAICKSLSSRAGARGVLKKVLMFSLVGAAHALDVHVLGGAGPVRAAVIMFFISNEVLSVVENAAAAGLPIPPRLRNALAQMQGREEEDAKKP